MTVKIGRVTLTTPLSIPYRRSSSENAGVAGPYWEKGFQLRGRDQGATAQATMDLLERETLRLGSVYVEDDADLVPRGYYDLEEGDYEKPGGRPMGRPWNLGLRKKDRFFVVRQAEDGVVAGDTVVDAAADEGVKVAYVPTTGEVEVLRMGNDPSLVLALRLDETGGTDGANLVVNPGFETYPTTPGDPASWTSGCNVGTHTRETSLVHGGSNALKSVAPAGGTTCMSQSPIPVVAGHSYYFEGWVRTGGAGAADIAIYNTTDATFALYLSGTVGGTVYEKRSGTFTAIAGKNYQLFCYVSGSSTGYFDDIVVKEIQAKDASGYGNHGTLLGGTNTAGPTINQTGEVGTAYLFDGVNDTVSVPDSTSFNTAHAVSSLEAWIKPLNTGSGPRYIIEKDNAFYLQQDGTTLSIDYTNGSLGYLSVAGVIAAGVWAHVVATYDGATMKLYANGVLVGSLARVTDGVHTASIIAIGSGGGSGFFAGIIDEVRIYNRALTVAEIQASYRAGLQGIRRETRYASDAREPLNLPAGDWRVIARVQSRTTVTQKFRAKLLDMNGATLTSGSQATVGTGNQDAWTELDLGTFTVPEANSGANKVTVTVQANTDLNAVWLDRVRIVPA